MKFIHSQRYRNKPPSTPPPPKTGQAAPAQVASVLVFAPLYLAVFLLLHVFYQIILSTSSAYHATRRAITPVADGCTFAGDSKDFRVPRHLAVILAPTSPSIARLLFSTIVQRLFGKVRTDASSETNQPSGEWYQFQRLREDAFIRKTIGDLVELIRLSALSGVEEISVYTKETLPIEALQLTHSELQRIGYLVSAHELISGIETSENESTSSFSSRRVYEETSPASSGSSDDENETLASSNTSDMGDALSVEGSKPRISVGFTNSKSQRMAERLNHKNSNPTAAEGSQVAAGSSKSIRVNLMTMQDGKLEMARVASEHSRRLRSDLVDQVTAETQRSQELEAKQEEVPSSRMASFTPNKARIRSLRHSLVGKLTIQKLDQLLLEQGTIEEPHLLIVFGGRKRVRNLHGFPPWPIRLTELFFDPNMKPDQPYTQRDFAAALKHFSKSEQRYGR